jgi:hypothetical protein
MLQFLSQGILEKFQQQTKKKKFKINIKKGFWVFHHSYLMMSDHHHHCHHPSNFTRD